MAFEIIDFHTHPFLNLSDCICKYRDTTPMSAQITLQDLRGVGITPPPSGRHISSGSRQFNKKWADCVQQSAYVF